MASNSNVDDVNDQKEEVIQALKENPASAVALSKMLSCDACKSFARGPIRYCGRHHMICSICYVPPGDTKKTLFGEPNYFLDVDCPAKDCKAKLLSHSHDLEAVRAMKLLLPCKNRKNGCPKKGKEKEVEEHESECEFRFVDSIAQHGGKRMFKDLFSVIDKSMKENNGKWILNNSNKCCKLAYRELIEPDGRRFRVILNAGDDTFIKAYVYVIGGQIAANRYRVEMRLTSSDKEFTLTHHGPVFPIDTKDPRTCEESYWIAKEKFAIFNKGFEYFGEHNKDKNGEVIIPIMVKIIKKELNIPKKDPVTPLDMDVEEK